MLPSVGAHQRYVGPLEKLFKMRNPYARHARSHPILAGVRQNGKHYSIEKGRVKVADGVRQGEATLCKRLRARRPRNVDEGVTDHIQVISLMT